MSLLTRVAPFTNAGHIFLAAIQEVTQALHSFLGKTYRNAKIGQPSPVGTTLPNALEFLSVTADDKFPTRLLLLETHNGYTSVFNNAWRSRGWFEMAFPLTKSHPFQDVYFQSQPNTIRKTEGGLTGQYGALQFIRVADGQITRLIELVNDGGRWVFSTQGTPEPFEDLKAYEAPRKPDRFTAALLQKYLAALDLAPFDDQFFLVDEQHPGIGFEIANKP